jgi:hypothetical protein
LDFIERNVASLQPMPTGATWAVYDIKNRAAKLVGIVRARDKRTAVVRAKRDYKGGCLMVVRQVGNTHSRGSSIASHSRDC